MTVCRHNGPTDRRINGATVSRRDGVPSIKLQQLTNQTLRIRRRRRRSRPTGGRAFVAHFDGKLLAVRCAG